MEVLKFGGASVNSVKAIENVVMILQREVKMPTLVVFSAIGKTTNALEKLLDAYYKDSLEKEVCLKSILSIHIEILHALFPDPSDATYKDMRILFAELNTDLAEIRNHPFDQAYDQIVSYGERFSTLLISRYLQQKGILNTELDARKLIVTDSCFREGRVNWEKTEQRINEIIIPVLEQGRIVITQGFIASDLVGQTTTLGREGSDYTAAIFSYVLNASRMTIWKDVPGVLNADPKYFSPTQKLSDISYTDATELAYYGASVIHPKTIKPLQNKKIPLYVRSFIQCEEPGSWIGREDVEYAEIPSYIFKGEQVLISIYPKDFSFIAEENLFHIFERFVKWGVKINLMQNSALSFSICIDEKRGFWESMIQELKEEYDVVYNDQLSLITIRHYTPEIVEKLVGNKRLYLEQRSRNTVQIVVSTL